MAARSVPWEVSGADETEREEGSREMPRITSFRESQPRYTALRLIGWLCSMAGAFLMAIGLGLLLLAAFYALAARGEPMPVPPTVIAGFSVLWSFGILLTGLQLFALGSFLRLMIHLEENTRASAQALDAIRSRLESDPSTREALFRS
jgi:hypothetical protein